MKKFKSIISHYYNSGYTFIDVKEVITLIQHDHPQYTHLIHDYMWLLQQLGDPILSHTYREANMVADALAKNGSQLTPGGNTHLFDHSYPKTPFAPLPQQPLVVVLLFLVFLVFVLIPMWILV